MLKTTGIKLELMTNIDMFQFVEKGMHGSISYIANRHLEASNPYMSGYNAPITVMPAGGGGGGGRQGMGWGF